MSTRFEEPTIPRWLHRPLAAIWISLGLHAALIALIQVTPPKAMRLPEPVIEARLVTAPVAPPAMPAVEKLPPITPDVKPPKAVSETPPAPVPSVAPAAMPVIKPLVNPVPPAPAEPAAPLPPPAPSAVTPAAEASAPAPSQTPPGLAVTSSVDLTFYGARELDVQPHALRRVEPDYPTEADKNHVSGRVRLQLKLEADGRVIDIRIVSATPPGLFEDSALKAFRDARFTPGEKNGQPVRVLLLIDVLYDWAGHAAQLGSRGGSVDW